MSDKTTQATSGAVSPSESTITQREETESKTSMESDDLLNHSSTNVVITITVFTLLSVVIVCVITATVVLYFVKRRQKRQQIDRRMAEAIADLRDNSTDNAAYGGNKFSSTY